MGIDLARYQEAKRLRDSGMTFKDVGSALGVGVERARQMVAKQVRIERARGQHVQSAAPEWQDKVPGWVLCRLGASFKTEEAIRQFFSADVPFARGRAYIWDHELEKSFEPHSLVWINKRVFNLVRLALGYEAVKPRPKQAASEKSIKAAKSLLERSGFIVTKSE